MQYGCLSIHSWILHFAKRIPPTIRMNRLSIEYPPYSERTTEYERQDEESYQRLQPTARMGQDGIVGAVELEKEIT